MTMTHTHNDFTASIMPASGGKTGRTGMYPMAAKTARIAAIAVAAGLVAASTIIGAVMIYTIAIGVPLINY